MKKLNVVGLGYIGLPTALMMAGHGVPVVGTDTDRDRVKTLERGELTFPEKGMEELFRKAKEADIEFRTECIATNRYLIAVPTPYDTASKKVDPGYLVAAVENVLEVCDPDTMIIVESTIPPGTIDRFVRPPVEAHMNETGEKIRLVHAPERIIPGNMVEELYHNSRTVGADDPADAEEAADLYRSFCKGEIVTSDIRTAEMTKVVENTFRDVNIAFANELARICRNDGMDVYEIISIANRHPRVNILTPGPGVGGHCISVDPWFLIGEYPELTPLIRSARDVNDGMPEYVLRRLSAVMKENGMKDLSRVGFYGLTYKENVDDTRESPTLQLLSLMEESLAFGVTVYDPLVAENMVDNQVQDFDEFLEKSDVVVILVAHDHLKENMDRLKGKIVFDTKNVCPFDGVYKL